MYNILTEKFEPKSMDDRGVREFCELRFGVIYGIIALREKVRGCFTQII